MVTRSDARGKFLSGSPRLLTELLGMSRLIPDLTLPEITSENFEQSLSQPLFCEFFNEFLQQPVFVLPLRYDDQSSGFELLSDAAVRLSCRIRAAVQQMRSRSCAEPLRDNRYSITRLDRQQTLRWLHTHRLAFFLHSDCYFEFRLASCLSQLTCSPSPHRQQCDEVCSSTGQRNSSSAETPTLHTEDALQTDRRSFLDFKRSLLGGPGESLLELWMNIERLKTLSSTHHKSRYVLWMRAQYVWSSSDAVLDEQLLLRLGLKSAACWQEDRLPDVQPRLTELLLLYWGQRFHLFPSGQWRVCESVLSSSVSETCTHTVCTCRDTKAELERSEIHTLLEVLQTESRSGFFFTHFCQNSGQQLWENAVYFCSELLQYRQLFCQSRFDPYRAQRTAQLLFVSYLSSGAQMNVCVTEESRRCVLTRLSPAFEDLFDPAEEHALNILLEAWGELTHTLTDPLHTVALWQEVRYAEPELFQMLQTLYTHTQSRQQQERRPVHTPAEGSRGQDLWAKVPLEFRRFRLDSLLQNHTELQHFLSFLEERSASVVLQCWLDGEQLKRSDGALLEERNRNFRDKYLNSSFLFGADSPASEEQQRRLLQVCAAGVVSPSALSDLQALLHSRLEAQWLPLFLSSAEFRRRQQHQVTEVCEQQPVVHQRRKRREAQVCVGGMSVSQQQQAVCVRRALQDPVTRLQFQQFLSSVDALLENDLLFWLEVQRYKELCHSRCDEQALQRKVSIIISRFFRSSVPPALQIHVPPDAALLVTSMQKTLGPYIFRETQMCVFEELLKHWPEFCALRSSVCADALLRVLDQKQSDRRRSRQTDEQSDSRSQVTLTPAEPSSHTDRCV
nr:regulator of G-protein signaling 22 [Danio rerio]|eukprot:XP_021322461.1 regulator of G-protein signaling 22 [Danio rerio]